MLRHALWAPPVIAIDQITKQLAMALLAERPTFEVMPVLNFTLVFNRGAAFGMFGTASGWQHVFFVAIAVIVSAAILFTLWRMPASGRQAAVALGMVLGGAIGNLIDRLVYGHVIDFIDVHWSGWHFWTFNVADSAISIGAVLLVLDALGLHLIRARQPLC